MPAPRPAKVKPVAIAVFDGFQLLDATGPVQVFATANAVSGRRIYDVALMSARGGLVRAASGVEVMTHALPAKSARRPLHTALIVGGEDGALRSAARDTRLRAWLVAQSKVARRFASVCSGAFLLAATGALDGRRAATHWRATAQLQAMFPAIAVDPDAIYVREGRVWTSAGVTAGIDMALAMVQDDCGRDLAARVAKQLVVYMRRPGHQSQFSAALIVQSGADDRLAALAAWVETQLDKPLSTDILAAHIGMSPRTFHRHVKRTLNCTPKKWIEDLRLGRARARLEETGGDLAAVAATTGFSGPDQLIRVFGRRLGLTPGAYRRLHARPNEILAAGRAQRA